MSEQKICPTCGTEYPLSERFCPRDGTALRSASQSADLLGSIVADRYHILKKLGEGGMGTVYLAEHVKMGRKSALKVMNPGMNTDPDAIARFNREASNASRLSHPNICGIYDFGETPDGLIYLAMEFIEGASLTSLIEKGGSLPAPRAASLVHQTADALQVAHDAGIVHRDLKPDNIMVARNRDGSDLVKVVDFGIAKASSSDAQKVTKTGLVVGTPEYMSPEQLAGDKLDGRSDIYSLGLVAFNCLTGALPFAAETAQEAMIMRLTDRPRTLEEVAPDRPWPASLQAVLDKALARDAGERYQSAAQFGREFAAAIADMPMTQAVEAGTMVLNATGAVPDTRVAPVRPSGKTMPMEAPVAARKPAAATQAAPSRPSAPAPASKSSMPAVLGGVVGLAVVGVVAWQLLGTKPSAPDTTPSGAQGTSPPSQVATDSGGAQVPAPAGTPSPAGGTPTQTPNPTAPLGNPGTKVPVGTPPGSTTAGGGAATAPTAPLPGAAGTVRKWLGNLDSADVKGLDLETAARGAIREVEPMLGTLSGLVLDDAHYVVLLAYRALDSNNEVCRYGKLVRASRLPEERKQLAREMMTGYTCPP